MSWWRVYVVDGETNENLRTEDFEADGRQAAQAAADALLRPGERVDQVVGIQP